MEMSCLPATSHCISVLSCKIFVTYDFCFLKILVSSVVSRSEKVTYLRLFSLEGRVLTFSGFSDQIRMIYSEGICCEMHHHIHHYPCQDCSYIFRSHVTQCYLFHCYKLVHQELRLQFSMGYLKLSALLTQIQTDFVGEDS